MDECIGSLMPLYAFVTGMPEGAARNALKNVLYASERLKTTWLIRPAMYTACEMLYNAHKAGAIYGAFIFSNNSSQGLVDFVADFLNGWMTRRFSDYKRLSVFKIGVCRGSPLRSAGSLEKSISEIQRVLAGRGLPLLTDVNDLMFFDDLVHTLTAEIPNYVQVRPYMNYCPLDRVITALSECEATVGKEAWSAIVEKARRYDAEDRGREYLTTPPTVRETIADEEMFRQAFRRFLGPGYGARGGGARRRTRKRRQPVRKNTLRHK